MTRRLVAVIAALAVVLSFVAMLASPATAADDPIPPEGPYCVFGGTYTGQELVDRGDAYWNHNQDGTTTFIIRVEYTEGPCESSDPDSDGDGVPDSQDAFDNDPNESADSDSDGVGDNADQCEGESGTAETNGCAPPPPDSDGDGIPDDQDAYPHDRDNDGVDDGVDQCPDVSGEAEHGGCEPPPLPVDSDSDGIPDSEDDYPNDRDNDGVDDDVDVFPDDPSETTDSDGDGIGDSADQCDDTTAGATIGADGCEVVTDPDSDGDGVPDSQDAFDNDPNESADSDSDGVGDNADQCSGTPAETEVDSSGCAVDEPPGDRDGDHITDDADRCPDDEGPVSNDGCPDEEPTTPPTEEPEPTTPPVVTPEPTHPPITTPEPTKEPTIVPIETPVPPTDGGNDTGGYIETDTAIVTTPVPSTDSDDPGVVKAMPNAGSGPGAENANAFMALVWTALLLTGLGVYAYRQRYA